MLEKQLTYIFSSDTANGAQDKSPDGSQFSVTLYEPIAVPHNARYCTVEVQGANIWYTTPNVSVALDNNVFAFNDGVSNHVVTIPTGLYDLGGLANSIYLLIDNIPAAKPSDELFVFSGDSSTQKVLITFKSAGLSIDWTLSTVRKILGYETTDPPTAGIDQTISGSNIAKFNVTNSFLIATDLIHTGIPVNAIDSGVIANVFIDVAPGSLINYSPNNIPVANALELIGAQRSRIRFFLFNQNRDAVDTFGEEWSFTMIIRYYLPEE